MYLLRCFTTIDNFWYLTQMLFDFHNCLHLPISDWNQFIILTKQVSRNRVFSRNGAYGIPRYFAYYFKWTFR